MRRTVRTKHTEKADRPEPGLCVKILPPSSHWPLRQPRCGLTHPLTAGPEAESAGQPCPCLPPAGSGSEVQWSLTRAWQPWAGFCSFAVRLPKQTN